MPVEPSSRVGRLVTAISGTRGFARVAPLIVPRLDRLMHRLTGGRLVLSAGMLPSLMLTTTGAKTGKRRTTPLATQPDGGCWYVVGSNFGRESHPAWTANLIANPEAEITFKSRTIPVKAHLLSAEEKAEVWPRLLRSFPNYDVYTERSGRDIRVFRLDPSG
jgi:deazaflavin-dependent oxidoreductase (nitroreductase family)